MHAIIRLRWEHLPIAETKGGSGGMCPVRQMNSWCVDFSHICDGTHLDDNVKIKLSVVCQSKEESKDGMV